MNNLFFILNTTINKNIRTPNINSRQNDTQNLRNSCSLFNSLYSFPAFLIIKP